MEKYRSMSTRDGRIRSPSSMHDLRSYSTSHTYTIQELPQQQQKDLVVTSKKNKGNLGSLSMKKWNFNDPEVKRKKRVAGYNVYKVEGKMKGSLRKSFKWVKDTCNLVVHGWS